MIVADTHAWFWWVTEYERLSAAALHAFKNDEHAISPMTMWEIAMLSDRNRINIDAPPLEWIERAMERTGTILLPIVAPIAVLAGTLRSDWIRDPSDRLIVATAIHHRLPLVTTDGRIQRAAVVETIW